MNFEEKKQRIIDALLERYNLQQLLNVAAEMLDNPIFICDMSFHVLAYSSNIGAPDDIGWNVVCMNKRSLGTGVREACLKEIISSGAIAKTMQNDKPVIDSFSFTPYRYVGARILDHTHVIGNATVIEYNHPFTPEDASLLKFFCRVVVYEMISRGHSPLRSLPYYGLLDSLLHHDDLEPADIQSRAKVIGLRFPAKMQVVAIAPNESLGVSPGDYLSSVLLRGFSHSMGIVLEDHWIALILSAELSRSELQNSLKQLLGSGAVLAGVSRCFTNPGALKLFYQQAKTAVALRRKDDENVFFYDDCYIAHLIRCAASAVRPEIFVDPLLLELERYDQENQTSFVRDLDVFLRNGRSISRAAKALFLHKNTMYYKISRIEEILNISLEDEDVCFSLELSLRMR